jgi:hypothetical protein
MRTKNKTKDFDAKFEEWWEIAKELENNLAQHTTDEKTMRYKLEVYQQNFLDFVYGNPTSTKALGQDKQIEAWPSRTFQEEVVQIKELQDIKR